MKLETAPHDGVMCFFDWRHAGDWNGFWHNSMWDQLFLSLHASGVALHSCHSNIVNHQKKAETFVSNSSHLWAKQSCLLAESWLTRSLASSITALFPKPSSHTHPPIHSQLQGPSHSCIQIFTTSCTGATFFLHTVSHWCKYWVLTQTFWLFIPSEILVFNKMGNNKICLICFFKTRKRLLPDEI